MIWKMWIWLNVSDNRNYRTIILLVRFPSLQIQYEIKWAFFPIISAGVGSNDDANLFDPHTPFKMPTYDQFKNQKSSTKPKNNGQKHSSQLSHMSWSLLAQASNQVPNNTPSVSKEAFIHPVYMREEDVNRLIRNGHIFFTDGRLQYREKFNTQKQIS